MANQSRKPDRLSERILPDDPDLCREIIRQQVATIEEAQRRIEQLQHQIERVAPPPA